MTALTVPITLSPGYAVLEYGDSYIRHSASVRYTAGTDITNFADRLPELAEWASYLQECLPVTFYIDSWRILNDSRYSVGHGNFATAFQGHRTAASNQRAYECTTLTIVGTARTTNPGVAGGNALHRFYVRDGFPILPREKYLSTAVWPELEALGQFLAHHPALWADYYGLKPGFDQFVQIHFNSHTQKSDGS